MLGGRGFLLMSAVLAAAGLLAAGVYLPFMRLSSLLLVGHGAQEHSLISAVQELVSPGQLVLGGLLLAFALLLPLLKLLYLVLLALLSWGDIARLAVPLRGLAWLGRWWPQDLVALAAIGGLLATQEMPRQHVAAGAYCFAAAILAMLLAHMWRRPDRSASATSEELAALRSSQPPPHASLRGPWFALLAVAAAGTFGVGLWLPVIRAGGAGVAGGDQSIVQIVLGLQARGQTRLLVPLVILTVVLPGLRLVYLLAVAAAPALPRAVRPGLTRIAGAIGRHATADIIGLSLMLFYLIETRAVAPLLQPGVYCLAASAALTLAAYAWANTPPPPASAQPSSLVARLDKARSAATAAA